MSAKTLSGKGNLFEIENARNLNRQQLARTFVPTQSFWRLLSPKHHIILGSRGSGKTALAKMLSHDHLSLLDESRVRRVIRAQSFIGVYTPTRLEWVGGLKNKIWQSEAEKEFFFQWRLNVSSCIALLTTVESCIRCYCGDRGQQARAERELSVQLSEAWADDDKRIETIDGLKRYLEDIEYAGHQQVVRSRVAGLANANNQRAGLAFETDLFIPLRRAITLVTRTLKLSDGCTWLICLDEAEFLEELHHRILNSHMRAYSGNVFFKITTMPYCHYTLATNTGVSLNVGDDFDYVYIDSDPVLFARTRGERATIGTKFARTLFSRRVAASGLFVGGRDEESLRNLTIDDLLGPSELLDEKDEEWSIDSANFRLLEQYCSKETISRAKRLMGGVKFKPQISRKIRGALLLRKAYESLTGNTTPDVYSGATLAIRCGDANPRRLIRIFNAFLLTACLTSNKSKAARLSGKEQTRVITKLSISALIRVQSEPKCGRDLYQFLKRLGLYMHHYFHRRPLATDQVTSIEVDDNISDTHWELIQRAVELGLLYPNIGAMMRGEMPIREGTFHLAFILAPQFFLLPRRGRSRRLSAILEELERRAANGITDDDRQLRLF